MKKALVLLVAAATLAGCASSKKPKFPEPLVGIEQVVGPAELNYPYGPFDIKYNVGIQNTAPFPITLIRVTLTTTGVAGGAYTLRRGFFYNFNETIPPRATRIIPVWAHAYGFGHNIRDTEPITLRGIVYFQSQEGSFQKVFMRELSQFAQ